MQGVYATSLYGLEGDDTTSPGVDADVMGTIDYIEDESAQETNPTDFFETTKKLYSLIEDNINFLAMYLENLKSTTPENYDQMLQEYNNIVSQYNQAVEFSMTEARISADPGIKTSAVNNLKSILSYTDGLVEQIKATGWDAAVEQSIESEGTPSTMMVKHEGAAGEEIVMQNVGIVRAWWEKINPDMRTIIKAAAIGGVIYGGSELFKRFAKKG